MKICSKCKEQKSFEDFNKDSQKKDGYYNWCRECANKKSRIIYAINIENERERSTKYYWDNLEKEKNRKSIYEKNNKQKIKEKKKNYYEKNKNIISGKAQKWQKNNPQYLRFKHSKYRAAKNGSIPPWLTKIHYMQIRWYYEAAKMFSEQTGVPHHVDHIHPLRGNGFSGLHVPWNLMVIKGKDNSIKGNRPPAEEADLFWWKG